VDFWENKKWLKPSPAGISSNCLCSYFTVYIPYYPLIPRCLLIFTVPIFLRRYSYFAIAPKNVSPHHLTTCGAAVDLSCALLRQVEWGVQELDVRKMRKALCRKVKIMIFPSDYLTIYRYNYIKGCHGYVTNNQRVASKSLGSSKWFSWNGHGSPAWNKV
jgi:hypothetical protein